MRIKSLQELSVLAKDFLEKLEPTLGAATIVGLVGELGAGKTAFVKAVASELGVVEAVTSPTFVIEKIYTVNHQLFNHLVHIDAYRLKNGAELAALDWQQIITDEHNLILIEWPERVVDILPEKIMRLTFTHIDEQTREIEYA